MLVMHANSRHAVNSGSSRLADDQVPEINIWPDMDLELILATFMNSHHTVNSRIPRLASGHISDIKGLFLIHM